MKKRSKYQVGGSSTDFFNNIIDLYQQSQDQQQPAQDNYDTGQAEDVSESQPDNSDYEDLFSKYQDLEEKVNSLAAQSPNLVPRDYGDSFLNFMFGEDNKLPVDFSMDNFQSFDNQETQSKPGFQSFGSYQEGKDALVNQLNLYRSGRTKNKVGPDSTLLQAMSVYAPESDNNNPRAYADFIARKIGVTPNTPIANIDPNKWAEAIEMMEGNKKGNNPGNLRKYQVGGIPVASSEDDLFEGLNSIDSNQLMLDLPNQYNMIRGLDNNKPIYVEDSRGKSAVLKGKNHTKRLFGPVYEKKL